MEAVAKGVERYRLGSAKGDGDSSDFVSRLGAHLHDIPIDGLPL